MNDCDREACNAMYKVANQLAVAAADLAKEQNLDPVQAAKALLSAAATILANCSVPEADYHAAWDVITEDDSKDIVRYTFEAVKEKIAAVVAENNAEKGPAN